VLNRTATGARYYQDIKYVVIPGKLLSKWIPEYRGLTWQKIYQQQNTPMLDHRGWLWVVDRYKRHLAGDRKNGIADLRTSPGVSNQEKALSAHWSGEVVDAAMHLAVTMADAHKGPKMSRYEAWDIIRSLLMLVSSGKVCDIPTLLVQLPPVASPTIQSPRCEAQEKIGDSFPRYFIPGSLRHLLD
jgi:hypothetical protein